MCKYVEVCYYVVTTDTIFCDIRILALVLTLELQRLWVCRQA